MVIEASRRLRQGCQQQCVLERNATTRVFCQSLEPLLDLCARRQEMMQRSGRRTVPQIWIGERHVGGCDELYELEAEGTLDAMLAA